MTDFLAIVAECHARGFRVRNLFERESDGQWQANLCDAKTGEGFIFAVEADPVGALAKALRLSIAERKPAAAAGASIFG